MVNADPVVHIVSHVVKLIIASDVKLKIIITMEKGNANT